MDRPAAVSPETFRRGRPPRHQLRPLRDDALVPLSGFLLQLRQKVGNDLLVLPSAAVAVFDEHGRILVGKHSDADRWVLPGGLIEPGESPADAAVRECWEETGLLVEPTGIFAVLGGGDLVIHYKNGDKAAYVTTVFRATII